LKVPTFNAAQEDNATAPAAQAPRTHLKCGRARACARKLVMRCASGRDMF